MRCGRAFALALLWWVTVPMADAETIAVTYFDAHSIDPELEPLGRGLADMLITDLQQADGLRLVERNQLNQVLMELQLQQTVLIDPDTAVALGKGLGADTVITGSITVAVEGMRLDARVIGVDCEDIDETPSPGFATLPTE